jgi:hypothetical protein
LREQERREEQRAEQLVERGVAGGGVKWDQATELISEKNELF